MARLLVILISSLVSFQIAGATDTPCRTFHGGIRVDSVEKANLLQNACVVEGPIGIFTKGVTRLAFPNLRKAKFINIEAAGLQAITFPQLKEVSSLYIAGNELQVAEFMSLERVTNLFSIRARSLRFVHLPRLGMVATLSIQNNPNLEFIFLDKISDIWRSTVVGNPKLNPSVVALLDSATRVLTAEQQEAVQRAREQAWEISREIMQERLSGPPPAPAPQAAVFGDLGSYYPYYQWYPYYFYTYWEGYSYPGRYYPLYYPYYDPYAPPFHW